MHGIVNNGLSPSRPWRRVQCMYAAEARRCTWERVNGCVPVPVPGEATRVGTVPSTATVTWWNRRTLRFSTVTIDLRARHKGKTESK